MAGRPKSEATRLKMSEAAYGRVMPAEQRANLAKAMTKHGYSGHPHYNRHSAMMSRCYDPTNIGYIYYGARGITVCAAWHDLRTFCDWLDAHLGPCPKGFSIDRIDNDGNYEPGNVRWATKTQQSFNRRGWANTGMTHSPEHRARISASLRARKKTP